MSTIVPPHTAIHPPRPLDRAAATCGARRESVGAWRAWAGTVSVAAAALAQAIVLAAARGITAIGVMISIVATAVAALAWHHRRLARHADVLLATAAFGGLGMMIGDRIARIIAPPLTMSAHAHGMHHAMPHAAASMLASAVSVGVMLVVCVVACHLTCVPLCRGGRGRRAIAHAVSAACMVAGMYAAHAIPPSATPRIPGSAAGMHVAMVVGMVLGAAAALPLIAWLDARARHPRPSATPAEG